MFEGMETNERTFVESDEPGNAYDWQAALDKAQGREPPTNRTIMSLGEFTELTKT